MRKPGVGRAKLLPVFSIQGVSRAVVSGCGVGVEG
jgi:hypothetical protein